YILPVGVLHAVLAGNSVLLENSSRDQHNHSCIYLHMCLSVKSFQMLKVLRDLMRPPTLRPLLLVIPFFFFVHFAGLTAMKPYMVLVFRERLWTHRLCSAHGVCAHARIVEQIPSILISEVYPFRLRLSLMSTRREGETDVATLSETKH
ncbi:hypothetical protein L9F63_013841, partial [Diploptera punctata]